MTQELMIFLINPFLNNLSAFLFQLRMFGWINFWCDRLNNDDLGTKWLACHISLNGGNISGSSLGQLSLDLSPIFV